MLRKRPRAKLSSLAIFVAAMSVVIPAVAKCPYDTQFFAYGGSGSCVRPGTNEVLIKCFRMPKSCPSGWSREHQDDQGTWCCPPLPVSDQSCTLRGEAPICRGRCEAGEINRGFRKDGCLTGHKAYCCRPTFPQN